MALKKNVRCLGQKKKYVSWALALAMTWGVASSPAWAADVALNGDLTGSIIIKSGETGAVGNTVNITPGNSLQISTDGGLKNASSVVNITGDNTYQQPGGLLDFAAGSSYTPGDGTFVVTGTGESVWDAPDEAKYRDFFGMPAMGGVIFRGDTIGLGDFFEKTTFKEHGHAWFSPDASVNSGNVTIQDAITFNSSSTNGGDWGEFIIIANSGTHLTFEENITLKNSSLGIRTSGLKPTEGSVTFAGITSNGFGDLSSVGVGRILVNGNIDLGGGLDLETYRTSTAIGAGGGNTYKGTVAARYYNINGNHNFEKDVTAKGEIRENGTGTGYSMYIANEVRSSIVGVVNDGLVNFGKDVVVTTGDKNLFIAGQTTTLAEGASIEAGSGIIDIRAMAPSGELSAIEKDVIMGDGPEVAARRALHAQATPELIMSKGSKITAASVDLGRNSTLTVAGAETTANITGKATFGATSTLNITRSGTSSGKLVVSEMVTIEKGAKVSLFGSDALNDSNKTILTAGSFANGNVFDHAFYQLAQSGQDIIITGVDSQDTMAKAAGSAGMTANFTATSRMVDAVLLDTSASADTKNRLVGTLESIANLADAGDPLATEALRQLSGEEALSSVNASLDTVQQQSAALGDRFTALHDAGPAAPAAGYGAALNRLWINGFGNWSSQDNSNNIYGYDFNSSGIMIGYDREVAAIPGLTTGIAASLSHGDLENNSGFSSTEMKSLSFGLYSSYQFGGGFFLDSNVNYGHTQNEATINRVLGGATASTYDTDSWQMGLNLGYSWNLTPQTRLIPSVGLQYVNIAQDGWQEQITSDPNGNIVANWYDDNKTDFLEMPVRLRLNTTFETKGGAVITPEIRLGGIFLLNAPDSQMRMGFVGATESTSIIGIDPGKSRFQAGTGLKAQLNDAFDANLNYDYETRSGFNSHTATLTLAISF